MSIAELKAVVPPPEAPANNARSDSIVKVEDILGTRLPNDLLKIAKTYGSGWFLDYEIGFNNPFDPAYEKELEASAQISRKYSELFPDFPFDSYPRIPGLLAWGHDSNGHGPFYLTDGPPDRWPIILVPHGRENEVERWDQPLTSFLASAFSGTLKIQVWTESFHGCDLTFNSA